MTEHVDEKHAIQHQESSELDRGHSHQEVVDKGSEEAQLHESEKDFPVRWRSEVTVLIHADENP